MHFLLFYDVSDDYLARRGEFRAAHLAKAWDAHGRGDFVLGGTLGGTPNDPLDGAVLLFKGDSPRVAEQFAETDPYVLNGLVKRWRVRVWNTVVGAQASNPVQP